MRKLIENVEEEGFDSLLGENIIILGVNYIYTGRLIGVNGECILLENPSIVYLTGSWNNTKFEDAQKLPFPIYIQKSAIEGFGKTNKE